MGNICARGGGNASILTITNNSNDKDLSVWSAEKTNINKVADPLPQIASEKESLPTLVRVPSKTRNTPASSHDSLSLADKRKSVDIFSTDGGGRRTLTTSSSGSPKKTSMALPQMFRKSRKSRKSLTDNDDAVIAAREKWMQEEKEKMADHKAAEWEAIFKDVSKQAGKEEITKQELMVAFAKMGKHIDIELISKVFVLFDANGDGVVDLNEFMVAMLFLSYRGSAKDKIELAFRLFDTNRSGDVSRREFSDMVAAIVGTNLRILLRINESRPVFQEFLIKEFAAESFNFMNEVDAFKATNPKNISLSDAQHLRDLYVVENAKEQVNIPSKMRVAVVSMVQTAETENATNLPWDLFESVYDELIRMLERDKLAKFKHVLKNDMTFADEVWKNMKLTTDSGMTMKQFRKWSENYPGIFDFLDEINRSIMEEEKKKAAALKIQRLRRKKVAARESSLSSSTFTGARPSTLKQYESSSSVVNHDA